MKYSQITVVTITYNLIKAGREKYVRQCIESVKNQTYPNIEHIIIDGASTDGTLEIFKDYPWLKVYSEPDKGIYDAMNKGVAHANGKYIAFLNSDDFWHDNRAVEASVKALEDNNADFSYATVRYLDDNDNFVGYLFPVLETFFLRMPFGHQSMFTRTELVHFDSAYKSSGDFDFVLSLILSGAKGVRVHLDFTSFRWIGMSSGKTNDFENEGCKLTDEECIKSIQDKFSHYGVTLKDAEGIYFDRKIKRQILEKILERIDSSLALSIRKKYLKHAGSEVSVFYDIPAISKYKDTKFNFKRITLLKIRYYGKFKVYFLLKYFPFFILPARI